MHRRLISCVVALVLVAAACSSSDDGAEERDASDLTAEFGQDTVDAAVDVLAGAGIEVRVRPEDDPLEDVGDESPLRLLRFQARNLALEANKGGGTLGADLDVFAEAAGGVPVSFLIAGWARNSGTPSASIAAELLDVTATPYPPDLIIPSYVVALFLGDITAGAPGDQAAGFFGQSRPSGQRVAGEDGDFCAQVSAYLAASLGGLLDPDLRLEPQWLQAAIDVYGAMEPNPERIRTSVGAMSLLVYATSISRPWVPLLVPRPFEFHHQVGEIAGGETTEIRLSVDIGEETIAEEAADCATLAGVTLPEQEVEGTSVLWYDLGLLPHVNRVESGGDLELDENGNAIYEYEPIAESADDHKNGTLNTAVVPVAAVVKREEIEDVKDAIETLLTGGDLGVAAPEVVAAYARMEPMLERLLYPRANTAVTVRWHTPKPPDEEDLGQCPNGCAASNGDPHLVPVEGAEYDFQAAGEFTLLRSTDGTLEIQARQEPVEGSTTVSATTAVAANVGGQRLAIHRADGTVDVRIDGEPVSLREEVEVGDGGSVAPYAEGVEVTFPDGTVMWVVLPGSPRLDVIVSPSDDLHETGQGLLGHASDEGYGLPPMADGTIVPEPADTDETFDLVYGDFADSWRVTAETSLFDYAEGESPETFVVTDFPSRPLQYEDLTPDQLALGEEACAEVESPVLHRQCVFDVGVTGDATYADVYATIGNVVVDAAEGLGDPGQILVAPALPEPEPPADTGVTVTIEPEPMTTTGEAAEPREGEPSATLTGNLVASFSDQAYDDDVVTALSTTIRAEEGTVLVMRADQCPEGDAIVFVSVTNVESGVSAPPFLCDPGMISGMTSDEDDELVAGETYVWLPAAGVYEVYVDTDALEATPMTIELFTDPTPTIVSQADVTSEGLEATLSGIGDTVVLDLDGSATDMVNLAATGLDMGCVVEAWGAEPVGSPEPWSLGYCAHADTAGSGIPAGGIPVPVVMFAHTDDEIDISVTPGP